MWEIVTSSEPGQSRGADTAELKRLQGEEASRVSHRLHLPPLLSPLITAWSQHYSYNRHLSHTQSFVTEITKETSGEQQNYVFVLHTTHTTHTPVCYRHRMFSHVFLLRMIDVNLPKSSINFCFHCDLG